MTPSFFSNIHGKSDPPRDSSRKYFWKLGLIFLKAGFQEIILWKWLYPEMVDLSSNTTGKHSKFQQQTSRSLLALSFTHPPITLTSHNIRPHRTILSLVPGLFVASTMVYRSRQDGTNRSGTWLSPLASTSNRSTNFHLLPLDPLDPICHLLRSTWYLGWWGPSLMWTDSVASRQTAG